MKRVRIQASLQSFLDIKLSQFDLVDSPCPGCRSSLDLMQPDPDDPNRFLGACGECKRWYQIEVDDANDGVWLLVIPTRADLLAEPDPESTR